MAIKLALDTQVREGRGKLHFRNDDKRWLEYPLPVVSSIN